MGSANDWVHHCVHLKANDEENFTMKNNLMRKEIECTRLIFSLVVGSLGKCL